MQEAEPFEFVEHHVAVVETLEPFPSRKSHSTLSPLDVVIRHVCSLSAASVPAVVGRNDWGSSLIADLAVVPGWAAPEHMSLRCQV